MTTSTTTRPTVAQQRHAAGLRTVAAALGSPDPRAALRAARASGQIDPALEDHAASLLHLDASTTATLTLSRDTAHLALRYLVDTFTESVDPPDFLPGAMDETDLNILGDHALAIAGLAHALAGATFDLDLPAEPEPEDPTPHTAKAGQEAAARPRRTVQQATLAKLEALRGEFADDPTGLALLLALGRAWAGLETPPTTQRTAEEFTPPAEGLDVLADAVPGVV